MRCNSDEDPGITLLRYDRNADGLTSKKWSILKNGLCTIAMRTKMARNSGRSDIAWGLMGPSVGRSDPQWGRMLSAWAVKYSFNNIYAISSSSHSLVVWVLHTLRCPLAHSKYSGIFFISGVTLTPKEPKTAFAPLLGSSALSSSRM